jgi:hypothetical protein
MKILIAEVSHHHKVLENTYNLLKINCPKSDVTLFVNRDRYRLGQNERKLLFKNADSANWIIHKFHFSTFFIHFLLIARKYDVINIATGPENLHITNLINAIFFYICSIIYKRKVIVTVKNLRPYLKETKGINSFFLSLAVSNFKVLTFETNTLKDIFHNETKIPLNRLCVSYDRYTDLYLPNSYNNELHNYKKKYRVGLLGGVATHRRDYFQIINALKDVPLSIRQNMLFITLGQSQGEDNKEIFFELKKLVDIDYIPGFISSEDFDKRGSICNLLISPLRPEMEYGTYKGSGTFGDAVYLRKKVIIPSHVDPLNEFKDISLYYQDTQSLSKLFVNIHNLINYKIDNNFYNKFTTKEVYRQITKVSSFQKII